MRAIRYRFPAEWDRTWKHDAYLGLACETQGWELKEAFDAYSRAYERSDPPTLELKTRVAVNCSYPGIESTVMNPLRAAQMLEEVIAETPYIQAVGALIRIYDGTKNSHKIRALEELLLSVTQRKLHCPDAFMDVFNEYDPKLETWLAAGS